MDINNNNYIEDQNLLTPKFKTKINYHNFNNINLFNKSDCGNNNNKKEKINNPQNTYLISNILVISPFSNYSIIENYRLLKKKKKILMKQSIK